MSITLDSTGGLAGLLHLRNRHGARAVISLYGAHLLSWHSADGQERLYCSPAHMHTAGAPIRGGVPVCFPQFSGRGPLPKHGVVRTALWQWDSEAENHAGDDGITHARLSLRDNDATRALWPHAFLAQIQISLGPDWLSMRFDVSNHGSDSFEFSAALHTYLATPDVRQAGVHGLQQVHYIDTAHDNRQETQTESVLRITEEVDRIYCAPPLQLQLQQDGGGMLVQQQGFSDSVVWNPGPHKARQLQDMPGSDWTRMLCIEAAQIMQPVQLAPQASWHGTQTLRVMPA